MSCAKLGLGTVQWGMPYGISNSTGQPTSEEVGSMLRLAAQCGVMLLDTASAYGDAETVLGDYSAAAQGFSIVTKTLPLKSENIRVQDVSSVAEAFEESLRRLQCRRVYGLLVHHGDDLLIAEGERLWGALQELKSRDLVTKIGVSVYEPKQLSRILDRYPIDLVQLPFNLYDQRFLREGLLDRLKSCGVEVHSRSAFLQGLLLMPPDRLPGGFESVHVQHTRLYRELDAVGLTPLEGSLRFCLAQLQVDKVIVGCESAAQLGQIFRAASGGGVKLPHPELLAVEDESIVNPTRWAR